ncbi:MAG: hypothetical protein AAF211_33875, partial [Myxococcota bacterium]
ASGAISIASSEFSSNTFTGWGGGARLVAPRVDIIATTFTLNSAERGGGLLLDAPDKADSNWTLTAVNFDRNSASGIAGALYANGEGQTGSVTLTGDGNAFVDNRSGSDGGGLYLSEVSGTHIASAWTGNSADGSGGGIYVRQASLDLVDPLVRDNNAGLQGGGMYLEIRGNATCTANPAGTFGFLANVANDGGGVARWNQLESIAGRFSSTGCDFGAVPADDNSPTDVDGDNHGNDATFTY